MAPEPVTRPRRRGPEERELETLLGAVAQGDEAALGTFYDRTVDLVFRAALRILRDRHWAEEVTLDVFAYVWRSPGRFDPERGSVPVWLMTLVRSRAIDNLRSQEARARTEDRAARERGDLLAEAQPSDSERIELRDALDQALDQLPDEQKQVLELAFFPGLTHVEIAERTGQPLGTVKSRIRLGMTKLREVLAPLEETR